MKTTNYRKQRMIARICLLAIVAGVLFVLPKTLYAVTLTEDTGGNNFGCKWWPQEKVLN